MTISGTVRQVTRRVKPYGSVFVTLNLDGSRFKFLHSGGPLPKRGDKITLDGIPIVGRKDSNVGGARITIHDPA